MNCYKVILPIYLIAFSYLLLPKSFDSHDIDTQLEYIFKNHGLMLEGHSNTILSIAIYKQYIITGSKDSTIRFWDKNTGHQIHILYEHKSYVQRLEVFEDILISASSDGVLVFWDLNDFRKIRAVKGHDGWISSIKVKNQHVWSSGYDGHLVRYDFRGGINDRKIIDEQIQAFDISENEEYLAVSDSRGNVTVWEGENLALSRKEGRMVNYLKIIGKEIVVSYRDEGIVVIGSSSEVQKVGGLNGVRYLKEVKGGFIGLSKEGDIFSWDLGKNKVEIKGKASEIYVSSIALEGKSLWFGMESHVSVIDLESFKIKKATEVLDVVIKVKINYDEETVITETEEGRICVWNLTSHALVSTYESDPDLRSRFFSL